MTTGPRLRFAPSPTGYLHVGNARAALFNWLEARRTGGEMLLRVEDTDRERSSSELVENILASLRWLGLDWDGDIVFQADNLDAHREAALTLLGDGTRLLVRLHERAGAGPSQGARRPARLRRLLPRPRAWRRATPPRCGSGCPTRARRRSPTWCAARSPFENNDHRGLRAPAVHRHADVPALQRVDDADMGITHVRPRRGPRQRHPEVPAASGTRSASGAPDVFAHLPMLVNEGRKKLSKRKDAVSVADFAAEGYLPEAMVNYLALLGWGPKDGVEIRPLAEIVELFRLEDVTPSPAFFDVKKLQHINAEYIRALPGRRVPRPVPPFLTRGEPAAGRAAADRRRSCRSGCGSSPRSSR